MVLDVGFRRVCPIQPHFLRRICWSVTDLLWPSDVKDASKTHVDEGLDLLHGGFCHSPCLRAIQQHGLDVGHEEAKLGGHADFH